MRTNAFLDVIPVPGPTSTFVTTNGKDFVAVKGSSATLTTRDGTKSNPAPGAGRISDTLMDDGWLVVVRQPSETAPGVATVTGLGVNAGVKTQTLDKTSELPTVSDGTWSLLGDFVVHATTHDGKYCLAAVGLADQRQVLGYCAPNHTGFNSAHSTSAGDSLLIFDDHQPSCRTVVDISSPTPTPFADVPACTGAEGALTKDGAIWSVVPNANQYDNAHYYARSGTQVFDLGAGTTGTLTPCGDGVYFSRDSQTDTGRARLMRWQDGQLNVVYESATGPAFLSTPRCAGHFIAVTSEAEGGDEQVYADVTKTIGPDHG